MTPTRILEHTPQILVIQWRPQRTLTIIAALIIGLIGIPILFVTGTVMTLQCDRTTTNRCQLITTYPIGSSTQNVRVREFTLNEITLGQRILLGG